MGRVIAPSPPSSMQPCIASLFQGAIPQLRFKVNERLAEFKEDELAWTSIEEQSFPLPARRLSSKQ